MNKPRVFISSTIYDFKDLRSAIKYYLEENGFEVVASENSDFQTSNKNNSYQTCLDAIETCDYFILLVGARVGGKYKYRKNDGKIEQITITRAEYRKAYDIFKQGRIKIINFVRSEIYIVKEDRVGLENVLKREFNQEEKISEIRNHESKVIKDAGEIFKFLEEISRNSEMKKANENDTVEYPAGNWIYQFSSFQDIITILNNSLHIKRSFNKELIYENIRSEIIKNLTKLTEKDKDGKIHNSFYFGLIDKSKLTTMNQISLEGHDLWCLMIFDYLQSGFGNGLSTDYIKYALNTDVFFEYDAKRGAIRSTYMHKFFNNMTYIVERIKIFTDLAKANLQKRDAFYQEKQVKSLKNDKNTYKIDGDVFASLINLPYLAKELYDNIVEFLKHYNNNEYIPKIIKDFNYTIFSEDERQVLSERVDYNELDDFCRNIAMQGENK